MTGRIGYLRPDPFLDHLTVIKRQENGGVLFGAQLIREGGLCAEAEEKVALRADQGDARIGNRVMRALQ